VDALNVLKICLRRSFVLLPVIAISVEALIVAHFSVETRAEPDDEETAVDRGEPPPRVEGPEAKALPADHDAPDPAQLLADTMYLIEDEDDVDALARLTNERFGEQETPIVSPNGESYVDGEQVPDGHGPELEPEPDSDSFEDFGGDDAPVDELRGRQPTH
jgi:hypothetical protein